MRDGLSQPSVMAISQDSLGRIWLGTREGVNIYDGYRCIAYKGWIADPLTGGHVWIGNNVEAIESDGRGNMYMVIDHALLRYDLRASRFLTVAPGSTVGTLAAHDNSIIYTAGDSIFVIDTEIPTRSFMFSVPSARGATHLSADSDNYYLSTPTGLHAFDRTSRHERVILPGCSIYSTYIGRDGTLWISLTDGGLYRLDGTGRDPEEVSKPHLPGNTTGGMQTRHAVEDHLGRIWYGCFTGLHCYDPSTGTTRHIEIPASMGGLTHSSVFGMFADRSGNIWAGTYYGGANYFSPDRDRFVNFSYDSEAPSGLFLSIVTDMVYDRRGNLWFGTDGAGVCCVDSAWNVVDRLTTLGGAKALRQNNVRAIAYEPTSDRLYIGTHLGGMSVYDIAEGTVTNYIDRSGDGNMPGDVIHAFAMRGDSLFISSRRGITLLDTRTGLQRRLLGKVNPFKMVIDGRGDLYYINDHGVYRLAAPGTDDQTVMTLKRQEPEITFTSLAVTDSCLYAGTLGDGIVALPVDGSGETWYTNTNSSLPDNYCYTLRSGDKGTLFVAGDRHVTRFNPSTGRSESVAFADYFPESSIINDCGLMPLRGGDVLVGSTKGITLIHADNFGHESNAGNAAPIYFSHLEVIGSSAAPGDGSGILDIALPYADGISLPHDKGNFTVTLGMNDYTAGSGNPVIEYRLDGYDQRWRTSDDGILSYSNIGPGRYMLLARRAGSDSTISIPVTVRRPWYNSWWAWLIYIIIAGGIGTYIIRKTVSETRLRRSLGHEKLERQRIEQLNHEKLVFFTNVSHEFQTPLTLIMSHIDLLTTSYSRHTRLVETLGRIRTHTQQMSHLITQLLEFRKLQQNHQVLRVGEHDGAAALRSTALPFVDYAVTRGITFTIDAPEEGLKGWYDPALISRVLVNIVSNAFKYTPDGGSIRCAATADPDGSLRFTVSDTGRGIARKDLPYIFARFYNGDSDEAKRTDLGYQSTGIGLAFAKSIIDKHHGTITAESREGEGTTFIVVIPGRREAYDNDENVVFDLPGSAGEKEEAEVPAADSVASYVPSEPSAGSDDATTERPLILIVEDNGELRRNLVSFFTPYFRVIEAADGEEGLDMARSSNPDLIISDVMMPRMSGTEMCRRIKSEFDLCHIPVILLTALSASESKLEGFNANADDYVTKPFESTLLLARIDNLLRNRRILQSRITREPVNEVDMTLINPFDRELLKRVTALIDSHIDDPELAIPYLCREVGVSRTLFFNKFKALTGMTPNAFILSHRLKAAAALLTAQPHLSIADIADMTGFTTAVYFSRCFKKQYGVSPQHYRDSGPAGDTDVDD